MPYCPVVFIMDNIWTERLIWNPQFHCFPEPKPSLKLICEDKRVAHTNCLTYRLHPGRALIKVCPRFQRLFWCPYTGIFIVISLLSVKYSAWIAFPGGRITKHYTHPSLNLRAIEFIPTAPSTTAGWYFHLCEKKAGWDLAGFIQKAFQGIFMPCIKRHSRLFLGKLPSKWSLPYFGGMSY